MRRSLILILAAALVLALAGCAQSTGTGSAQSGSSAAAPSAQTVWTQTISTKAYKSWQTAPGYETTQPAHGPHGKSVQVYVDPNITKTLSGTGATAWPVGSMIVKDAYDANGTQVQIEYMQKTDQGWYYASYGVDGTVVKEGVKVAPCQPCHGSGSDSVKSFKLPQS